MFNFKKNTNVYLVYQGLRYKVEVYPDLSATQTFDEQSIKRKTLHAPVDLHEHAIITKANPANFSFTVPVFDQAFLQKELELSCLYNNGALATFDLYFETDNLIYKAEYCVFETTTFNLSLNSVLSATLTGSCSKLYRVNTILGTLQTIPTRSYTKIDRFSAIFGTTTLSGVVNANIEISNSVEWLKNTTVHDGVNSNVLYPQNYVLTGRQVKGSLTHYLTSNNESELSDFSTVLPIELYVNSSLLVFDLPSSVFTRRQEFGDLFTRTYDFRLNSNTEIVKPIYKGV